MRLLTRVVCWLGVVLLGVVAWQCKPEPTCSEPQECPTCAGEKGGEKQAQDGGGESGPEAEKGESRPENTACRQDRIKCDPKEINAFGLCLKKKSMAVISNESFIMGAGRDDGDYSPAHRVDLSSYLIDLYEVSNEQYKACVDCGVCQPPLRNGSYTGREPYFGNERYDDYPVVYVTWKMARTYCEAIGKRLPTEAEWELAARGTKPNHYPWGNDSPSRAHANYGHKEKDTRPVDSYEKYLSPFGLYNAAGNVYEWVQDTYGRDYYKKSPGSDPKGPKEGPIKVGRGGSFASKIEQIRSYYRVRFHEKDAFSNLGFRCAATVWPPEKKP